MNITQIMKNRYSCRKFKDEKIKDDVVREIIDLTRLTPSSLALEPWKFVVVTKDIDKLGEICYHQSHVTNCSHAVVIMARTDIRSTDEYIEKIAEKRLRGKEKFISMISAKADHLTKKELEQYASLQCYMALANLVNIAYEKGVKSCIIGGFDKEKLSEFLNLGENLSPCIVVSLGLSDEKSPAKSRKNLEEILIWR